MVIKGNPKYWIKGTSEKLYNTIKSLCLQNGYQPIFVESTINPTDIPDGDVYIVFSRGCKYDKYINNPVFGIGCCHKPSKPNRIFTKNPCDNTCNKDHSLQSIKCHWTLTDKQINLLNKFLKKYNNSINEVSVMADITPYQKFEKPIYRTKFPK